MSPALGVDAVVSAEAMRTLAPHELREGCSISRRHLLRLGGAGVTRGRPCVLVARPQRASRTPLRRHSQPQECERQLVQATSLAHARRPRDVSAPGGNLTTWAG